MPLHQLELRFEPDSDGTGELCAQVRREHFAGAGSAWFSFREIEQFGQRLENTFPMLPGSEIGLRGGYWKGTADPPELQDVLLGLRVYPLGSTGCIGILVEVMDGYHQGQREANRARLTLELLTDYETIRHFGAGITQLTKLPGIVVHLNPLEE